jgi:hypothetical protein
MRRPVSKKYTPAVSGFTPELARGLVEYFQQGLERAQAAKAAGTGAPVKFPTVKGYCEVVRIPHNTLRSWGRSQILMRRALTDAAAIRLEISRLELPALVFDTEGEP